MTDRTDKKPEKGDVIKLQIDDMSAEGQGIGKADGFAVFVEGAVVGDVVTAKLTKMKKNYAFAVVESVDEPSKARREEDFCAYMKDCGGCPYGALKYEEQPALKERQIRDKLVRLGGFTEPPVEHIIGADRGEAGDGALRYRNKASMPVSTGGLITKKGGVMEPVHEPRIGFYRRRSHEVVDCADCMLQSPPAMAAARALRRFMEEDHITSYDERWGKGLLRHLIVRTAKGTGEVMVVLVVNGKAIPNAAKLVGMLDEAIYELPTETVCMTGEDGEACESVIEFSLESVVLNVNRKNTSEILGEECITIAGKPTISERVGGMNFEISPLSFYQVNPRQMERLYGKVLEYAALEGDETVLDLYCGVGTIGLFCAKELARRKKAAQKDRLKGKGGDSFDMCDKVAPAVSEPDTSPPQSKTQGRVIGIESVKEAVVDANRNAVINGLVNARFVCGRAEEVLPRLLNTKRAADTDENCAEPARSNAGAPTDDEDLRVERIDVAIVDPPRAGCHPDLIAALCKAEPKKIVYVSCDPATFARDAKLMGELGYSLTSATPCDMFPQTAAVEVVGLFVRG